MQYEGAQATRTQILTFARSAGLILTLEADPGRLFTLAEIIPASVTGSAEFGGKVHILDAQATPIGDRLALHLSWHVSGELSADLNVFVHVLDPTGALVAQADGAPARGLLSLAYLARTGKAVKEMRIIPLEGTASSVAIGVYNAATEERLSVTCSPTAVCTEDSLMVPLDQPR